MRRRRERFRRRYFDSLNSQAFGGNIADYREKVNGISGVGGVKVYPAWNGGGTVKLVIIGSDYGVPSDELIRAVKDTIDPEVDAGKGYGLAPIGHVVTVEGQRKSRFPYPPRLFTRQIIISSGARRIFLRRLIPTCTSSI